MRLDDDLSAFHGVCAADPKRHWIAKRGAGRLLRSATVFEDLMKLLFTTNTTWSSTEHMTRNLVRAVGSKSPSGQQAFPTPRRVPATSFPPSSRSRSLQPSTGCTGSTSGYRRPTIRQQVRKRTSTGSGSFWAQAHSQMPMKGPMLRLPPPTSRPPSISDAA